jgi:hypothetical protein
LAPRIWVSSVSTRATSRRSCWSAATLPVGGSTSS